MSERFKEEDNENSRQSVRRNNESFFGCAQVLIISIIFPSFLPLETAKVLCKKNQFDEGAKDRLYGNSLQIIINTYNIV